MHLAAFPDIEVVSDPDPKGKPDAWRTHRRCLEELPADASHLLVVQDDVLPRPDFAERVLAAIDAKPESLLLAFVPGFPRDRRLMHEARKAGAAFSPFIVGAYCPTIATVYPREVVYGLLDWVDGGGDGRRPMRGADDGILAHYCRVRKIRPLALVPCAADHDESVATVGKRVRTGQHRRAALL